MFRLRDPLPTDLAFVVDSWRQSYRSACERQRKLDGDEYFPAASRAINALLARPDVELVILGADDPDDYTTVDGWACLEGDTLHYVYVKEDARGMGGAKLLLSGRNITHYSHVARQVDESRLPESWQPTLRGRIL